MEILISNCPLWLKLKYMINDDIFLCILFYNFLALCLFISSYLFCVNYNNI